MSETFEASDQELNARVLAMATRTLALLERFGRDQATREELFEQLAAMGAQSLMAEHWGLLIGQPTCAPSLEVLQLLATLESEVPYQYQIYGATSLSEDYRELGLATNRLKRQVRQPAQPTALNGNE